MAASIHPCWTSELFWRSKRLRTPGPSVLPLAGGCTLLAFHLCLCDCPFGPVSLRSLWLPLLSEFCLSRTLRTERMQTHSFQLSSAASVSTSRCSPCSALGWSLSYPLRQWKAGRRGPAPQTTFLLVSCTGFQAGHPRPLLVCCPSTVSSTNAVTCVPPQTCLAVFVYGKGLAPSSGDMSFQCLASLAHHMA